MATMAVNDMTLFGLWILFRFAWFFTGWIPVGVALADGKVGWGFFWLFVMFCNCYFI